jgi:hypothetical protein
MPDHEHHCPFLNRSDSRCGEHLKIDRLGHAFDFCFDVYAACPVYLELLIERRIKSADAPARPVLAVDRAVLERVGVPHASRVVQVQVRRSLAYRNA